MKHLQKNSPLILAIFVALVIGALSVQADQVYPLPRPTKAKITASINAKINQANSLIKANKFADAIALLKPLASDLPRHGSLALAKAYHAQKNYLEETRILETIVGQNDKDYYVQNLLAECYLANRDLEKAADAFSAAKELKPDYLPAYEGLEKTYEAKGQPEDAKEIIGDTIHIFGPKKFFSNQLCRLYSADGSIQEGIDACQRATMLDPSLADNHIYLGKMLIENEQPERGEMIINKAAKHFQKSEIAQLTAADIKFKHKQWHEASDYFSQATIANSKSEEGFIGWAKSLFEMQKYSDAKIAYTKACLLNKKYLSELRTAIAALRQKDLTAIANQYETVLPRCGG